MYCFRFSARCSFQLSSIRNPLSTLHNDKHYSKFVPFNQKSIQNARIHRKCKTNRPHQYTLLGVIPEQIVMKKIVGSRSFRIILRITPKQHSHKNKTKVKHVSQLRTNRTPYSRIHFGRLVHSRHLEDHALSRRTLLLNILPWHLSREHLVQTAPQTPNVGSPALHPAS